MSNQSRCAKGESISNNGAYARHADACNVCERGAAEDRTAENDGLRASDMEMDEVAEAVRRADADTLDRTLDTHDHTPADEDTRESAAAKALIRAKSGGRGAYTTVFEECATPECEYGCNGFAATKCKNHGDKSGSSEPETAESEGSQADASESADGLPSEGQIAGRLISEGMEPETAAEAGAFVRDAIREGAEADEAVRAYMASRE